MTVLPPITGPASRVTQPPAARIFSQAARASGTPMAMVLRTMRQLAQEHMTMLVVTHEMAFAREVAHRVCFMDKGQIVEERAARAFFEDPHHERARAFLEHVL